MLRKLIKWVIVVFSVLMVIITGISLYLWTQRKDIRQYVVDEVNNNINARAEVSSLEIRLFHNFPKISARFSEVTVLPYHRKGIPVADTLMSAEEVFVDFNLWKLLFQKQISILSFSISNGKIFLKKGTDGSPNWDIRKESSGKKKNSGIQITTIKGNNLEIHYYDFESDLESIAVISQLRIYEIPLRKKLYRFRIQGDVKKIKKAGYLWFGNPESLELSGYISGEKERVELDHGKIKWQGGIVNIESASNTGKQFRLVAESNDIHPLEIIRTYNLPLKKTVDSYTGNGVWQASVVLNVNNTKPVSLKGEIHFESKDYQIVFPRDKGKIILQDLAGIYEFSSGKDRHESTLTLDSFTAQKGNSIVSGRLVWDNPGKEGEIKTEVKTEINAADLEWLVTGEKERFESGNISGDLNVRIPVFRDNDGKIKIRTQQVRMDGKINLKNFTGGIPESLIYAGDLTGDFNISGNIGFSDVKMRWLGFPVNVDGSIPGFSDLFSDNGKHDISVLVRADKFILDTLFAAVKALPEDNKDGKNQTGNTWNLQCGFSLRTLLYEDFNAAQITGKLEFGNNVLKINPVRYRACGGEGSGQFEWLMDKSGTGVVRAFTEVDHLNISGLFRAFDNFGQTFIRSENLEGSVSGSIAFQAQLDQDGNIDLSSLLSNASIEIDNGRLVNAEALYSLSKFISLSELEDIRFSTLKNEIFIQDQAVVIPSMNIGSSALNLGLYGQHFFDSRFEYHIHLLLSEILFNKAGKAKKENNEYGVIEEDQEGKTGLYLVYEGDSIHSKVYYDKERAKQARKEDLVREGKELKTILHQELGLFKKDTSLKDTEIPVKKKFRIVFPEEEGEKKDTGRKKKSNLFKMIWEDEPSDTSAKKQGKGILTAVIIIVNLHHNVKTFT